MPDNPYLASFLFPSNSFIAKFLGFFQSLSVNQSLGSSVNFHDSITGAIRMSDEAEANYFQVKDLSPSIVRSRIKQAMEAAVNCSLYIAPRKTPNVIYVSGRLCMKSFNKLKVCKVSVNKCNRILGLLIILLDLNKNKKFLSSRRIFYKNKELFQTQTQCDHVIDDVCCLLGATRRCLRIKAFPNGLVIGSIVIREKGKIFNLQDFDTLGKSISPYMSDFDVISCHAKFILVVEKEETYSSLIDDEFHKKVCCIMITGKGMPDMATRYFLRNLTRKLNTSLPVLALVDCDPYGIKIMSNYTCGSDSSAFDSENLVTPGIKWLGVRPNDWETYDISSGTTELSAKEKSVLEDLKGKFFLMDKTSWVIEISKMLKSKKTCDLGSLSSTMVLRKVAMKDWLPGIGDVGT